MVCANEEKSYTLINSVIPNHFPIEHVYDHQDDSKEIPLSTSKGNLI